jgi:hypothetical protein
MRWEQPGGQASMGARTLANDCSPEIVPLPKLCAGKIRCADPLSPGRRPKPSGKKRVRAPEGHRGVGGPSAHARIAEITSGRAISQQGLATTCKDSSDEGKPEVDERDLAWRMSQSERRRRGNALREDPGDPRRWGNTPAAQRGSRHLAGSRPPLDRAQNRVNPGSRRERVEPRSKPHQPGAYARQRLSFGCGGKAPWGQARAANRTREIRPSGMKTEASGNVAMGAGLRSTAKAVETPPDPTARALEIYPDPVATFDYRQSGNHTRFPSSELRAIRPRPSPPRCACPPSDSPSPRAHANLCDTQLREMDSRFYRIFVEQLLQSLSRCQRM